MRGIRLLVVILAAMVVGTALASPALAEVTPSQKEQLKSLAVDARRKIARERFELIQARRKLVQLYRDYNLDEDGAKTAREKISKLQLNLLDLHLDNQQAIRRVLTPEQFDAFARRLRGRIGGKKLPLPGVGEDSPMDHMPDKEAMQAAGIKPEQARQIRKQGGQSRGPIINKLRDDSTRLTHLYAAYDLDVAAARKLIGSIHQSQSDLSEVIYKRQQAMRALLTRAQFERLQEEIAKRIRPKDADCPFRRER